jgi:predicted ATP-grasp superfamily ATP-dependent carboligase/thymidylate kinase
MTFTVALLGGDGAGKTSVAKLLERSPTLRCKYLYMGQSLLSSNVPLPTSRVVRYLKLHGSSGSAAKAGDREGGSRPSHDPHYLKKKRGLVRVTASFLNRLAEAWWRQLLSVVYQLRGYTVIYDRHFLFESAPPKPNPRSKPRNPIERFEYWVLSHSYPKPDLVVFLDAPSDVLFGRKGEMSPKRLEQRRVAILRQAERMANFVTVDASQPLDQVFASVTSVLQEFRKLRHRRGTVFGDVGGGLSQRFRAEVAGSRATSPMGRKPHAVVVGLDHMNGVQTARILARRGVPVIGVANDRDHYCCRTRVCQRILFVDAGEAVVAALEELGPTLPDKAVLFPCTDMHVLLLSRYRDRLEQWFHLVLPAPETVEMLMDKVAFYRFAQQNELPIPNTALLYSREDAERAATELSFPCVLKPPLSADPMWEQTSKLKAYVVSTPAEFLATYDRHASLANVLIAQEWIEGPSSNLYSCNCYFGRDGRPVATFVARKLRQWPPETGESCLGEECRNDDVLEETIRLFKSVEFRGLAYLEMKRDSYTDRHFIVEPNVGRPTGRSAIAEAGGVELLYAMYCDALGWPSPSNVVQRYGNAKWMDIRRDLQSAVYEWRHGSLTLGQWWRSIHGPKTFALFSWTDPGPFLGDLQRAFRLFLSSEERRKRDYTRPLR